ncbi:MAG: hypothetical protein Fur0037_21290 [Planctomycetota bacterium]
MILLDNREVRAGWQNLKDDVVGIFAKHNAEVVSSKRWDERRLAYPIRGQMRGTYLLTYAKCDTQALAGIRRDLQFHEAVLRSLLKVCDEIPEAAYEPEAAFDPTAVVVDETDGAGSDRADAGPADGDDSEEPADDGAGDETGAVIDDETVGESMDDSEEEE